MGYEMGSPESKDKYIKELQNWVKSRNGTKDQIHIIWYCISVASDRIQDYDEDVLKAICNDPNLKNKIAVVLTKCDQDDAEFSGASAISDIIHNDIGNSIEAFRVSSNLKLRLDLEKLVEWSINCIDNEDIRKMFIASQMVNIKEKRNIAKKVIFVGITAATATAAIPIPVPDAPILTTEQVAMSAAIIACYGLNIAKGFVTSLVSDTIISNVGKTLVGKILKFIPGVGSVVGAVIDGSVAATVTAALGFAISEICYNICKNIANGKSVDFIKAFDYDEIRTAMSSFLNKNGNKSVEEIKNIVECDEEDI